MEVNKFYNMDCLDFMKSLPDKSIDLVLTSPPYNFNGGKQTGKDKNTGKYKNGYKDNLSYDEYFEWQKKSIDEMIRVSRLVFYNIQFIAGNSQSLLRLIGNFHKDIKEILIWNKIFAEPAINEGVLNSQFEFILCLEKNTNGRKYRNPCFDRGTVSNVWNIPKLHNWKNKNEIGITTNKAVFPIKLVEMILWKFSNKSDIILDPFSGSGTTAIACHNLNRKFICIEKDKEYFDKSVERYNKHIQQLKLL